MADLVKGSTEIPQTDTRWFSESGIIDLFIMLGPEPDNVFSQYGVLTGTTPIPPVCLLYMANSSNVMLDILQWICVYAKLISLVIHSEMSCRPISLYTNQFPLKY